MDAELKRKWIEALRSGEYEQGLHFLHNHGAFCCLGVLADVSGAEWRKAEGDLGCSVPYISDALVAKGDEELLAEEFAKSLGLSDQRDLADMNDEGCSFSEIADYIEEHL